MRQSDSPVAGESIYLPQIFPPEIIQNESRLKFTNSWIKTTLTPILMGYFEHLMEEYFQNQFLFEGSKEIRKSFALYFLVCFMVPNDSYSVCYLSWPSCREMDEEELIYFHSYYYPEILALTHGVKFSCSELDIEVNENRFRPAISNCQGRKNKEISFYYWSVK